MKYLLSLPPNVVGQFHQITDYSKELFFCTSDPVDQKLGSGGGTTWLLEQCAGDVEDFGAWLAQEQRILLHAGGQSRRLPAYAACGKVLLPVPVFRWARGQQLDQNLLDLQLPLYRKIMASAPASMHTLIASGDVYIRATERLQPIPEADVVCYGLWAEPTLAKNHGVFLMDRKKPETLDFVQSVFDEYLVGENGEEPVFRTPVIHIGTDEYYGNAEDYRAFADAMLKYVKERGYTPRLWGSLSAKKGKTPVDGTGSQIDVWSLGWQNPHLALEHNFDIINIVDVTSYIVPSGTGSVGGYGVLLNLS